MNNLTGSEQVALLGVISPGALAAQAHASGYVSVKNFERILIIIQLGTLGALGTVDATLQQAKTSVGGDTKALAKTVTQLVKASNDDDQIMINVSAEDFDVSNGFDWLQVTVTIGGAASGLSAVILGIGTRYGPARLHNAASVVQIAS